MADERRKRLMQEALDDALPLDARQELLRQLDSDPEEAEDYRHLRQVDRLLKSAPFESAPKTLAMNIMARIAEGLKQHKQLSHLSGLALAMALSLVTLVMIPLLMGAVWLFLNAVGSADALAGLMQTLLKMLSTVLAGLDTLIEGAQDLMQTYPETPALMLGILPVVAVWLARANLFNRDSDSDTSA